MSRRFIDNWGDDIEPASRAPAYIGLGIVIGSTFVERDVPSGLSDRLWRRALEDGWRNLSDKRWTWGVDGPTDVWHADFNPFERWRQFKTNIEPGQAVKIFETVREISAADVRLRCPTYGWEDDDWANTVPWLSSLARNQTSALFFDQSDWPSSRLWRWPLRLGFLPDQFSQTLKRRFRGLQETWIHRLIRTIDIGTTGQSCDILLVPHLGVETQEFIRREKFKASSIIALGTADQDRVLHTLFYNEASILAECTAIAQVYGSDHLKFLVDFIRNISHDTTFDEAIQMSSPNSWTLATNEFIRKNSLSSLGRELAGSFQRAGNDRLALEAKNVSDRRFLQETGGATELIELFQKKAEDSIQKRYLQSRAQNLFGRWPEAAAEEEHSTTAIGIRISPDDEKIHSLPPFPDERVDWSRADQKLQIILSAPGCRVVAVNGSPLYGPIAMEHTDVLEGLAQRLNDKKSMDVVGDIATSEITLREEGTSSEALFLIQRSRLSRHIRLIVSQGNRILQTGIIAKQEIERVAQTHIAEIIPLEIKPEGLVRDDYRDLSERRVFDLAFLTNDSLSGKSQITAISGTRVFLRDLDEIKEISKEIKRRFEDLLSDEFSGDKLAGVMANLAQQGVLIRDYFDDAGMGPILDENPRRIQIVAANPDEILPLEAIYDGDAPETGASICPNQHSALANADCGTCPNREGDTHVCAARFWGFRKIIERHLYQGELSEGDEDAVTPSLLNGTIPRPKSRIFAFSNRAQDFPGGLEAIQRLRDQIQGGHRPGLVFSNPSTWSKWKQDIQNIGPTLLFLLPHTDYDGSNDVLEIGDGDHIINAQINKKVVGNIRPTIVFLLGCETINTQKRYASFVSRFRRAKAAVIIGTMTPILGRHAAPIGEEIIKSLDKYWDDPDKQTTIGDALLDARRAMMRRGQPIGLAVVAFGDADWIVQSGDVADTITVRGDKITKVTVKDGLIIFGGDEADDSQETTKPLFKPLEH